MTNFKAFVSRTHISLWGGDLKHWLYSDYLKELSDNKKARKCGLF